MPGNRDFLVGDAMLASAGLMRLADPTVVAAFGLRLLVSHGDALCLGDTGYQRYRSVVRRRLLQGAFATLPRRAREAVGRGLRGRRSGTSTAPRSAVDLDLESTLGWMESADTPVLVHGHTHAPDTHTLAPGRIRHVMTDWHLEAGEPMRAEVLRWHRDGFERIAPASEPPVAG